MNEILSDIGYSDMRSMLKDCICEIQTMAASPGVSGISSGFWRLDLLTDGFENGKVYVIGARPCMGKVSLMLSMIESIVLESKQAVLLFSTNHMKSDYVSRLLAIHCDIPTSKLHKGWLDMHEWERLDKGVASLIDAPLFIHDCLDLPINELVETARSCVRECGIRIIFVDCLQMINIAKEGVTPSDRIAKVMILLKQLAYQLGLPIVVGSMMNRGVDYREGLIGREPQLKDLAFSSYIEGLADVVMMVHRPEYYQIYQDEDGRDMHGVMQIFVKKNGLKLQGCIYLSYQQDTGIVSLTEDTKSKPVSLEDFGADNETAKSLIKTFDLEEELPF